MKGLLLGKSLIYKASSKDYEKYEIPEFIDFKILSKKDIEKDDFLSTKKENLLKLLEQKHIGFGLYDKDRKRFFAYACIATEKDSTPPPHIKEMPKGSFWDHFTRVSEDYQGHGYQKLLIQERRKYLENLYGKGIELYSDTSTDNIASRKNLLRSGFDEYGTYLTVRIGSERTKPFYYHWFFWDKKKKHPPI